MGKISSVAMMSDFEIAEGTSLPSVSTRCGVCYEPLKNIRSSVSKILVNDCCHIIAKDVPVCDVIAYIYGTNSEDVMELLRSYSKNNSAKDNSDLSIALCFSCAFLLSESYRAHQRFEREINPSSFVAQLQTFKSRKCSSLSSKLEPIEFSYEDANSSDSLLNDFNFVDEEQQSELHSEEKYVPADEDSKSSHFSKVIIENPFETKSNIMVKDVIVKVEKLSGEDLKRLCVSRKSSSLKRKKRMLQAVKKYSKKRNIQKARGVSTAENRSSSLNPAEIQDGNVEKPGKPRVPRRLQKDLSTTCEICGQLLKCRWALPAHMRKRHPETLGMERVKSPCKLCGKMILEDSVKMHMERKHSGKPRETFKCEDCGKVFSYKVTLEDHIVIHRKDFQPFRCSTCGKTFHRKANLAVHETIHRGVKKFSCPECGKKFLNLHNMKLHLERHSTENKYVCEYCGKTFKSKPYWAQHVKIHKEIAEKGENSVTCPDCGKSYKHSFTMAKHRNRAHGDPSKKTIHKCSVCGKILSCATNLKLHQNLHENID